MTGSKGAVLEISFAVVLASGCGARTGDFLDPGSDNDSGGSVAANASGGGGANAAGRGGTAGSRGGSNSVPSKGSGGTLDIGTHPANHGGVGGAGFIMEGVCKRCGWTWGTEPCVSLVESVPAIDRPEYMACSTVGEDFALCLSTAKNTCSTIVPPECDALRSKLDACW